MANILIRGWQGRLGNNILQLRHAIQYALFYKYNVILPPHTYFNTTYICINNEINIDNTNKVIDKYNFLFRTMIDVADKSCFTKNNEEMIRILKRCFAHTTTANLDIQDVVIHIRSGDIFNNTIDQCARGYIMPPLSYYTNILNNHMYNKIYIVAEDTKNPCINKLVELYPNIHLKIQSLDQDIALVLAATNLIMSYGTFCPALLLLSDNIRNVYRPSYCMSDIVSINTINDTRIQLGDYKHKLTPWLNTPGQRQIMLTWQ
jgi:hypothetical protein